nr:zinc finger, CCHC-type [Tanacetum cinerariifolium]
ADKKPGASGRVFAITEGQAANTSVAACRLIMILVSMRKREQMEWTVNMILILVLIFLLACLMGSLTRVRETNKTYLADVLIPISSVLEAYASVMEHGPWLIRNIPIILRKWTLTSKFLKEEFTFVPLWIKLHGVSILAFTADGLSVIATRLDTLIMLDSWIVTTCMQSSKHINYTRALVDISIDRTLKEAIVISVPNLDGNGVTLQGGILMEAPKKIRTSHDGFQIVPTKIFCGPLANKRGMGADRNLPKKQVNSAFQKKSVGTSSSISNALVYNPFDLLGDMDDMDHVVVSNVIEVEAKEDKGSMSMVYVLTTPMPEDGGENPTMEKVKRRAKWDNDDYIRRGLILNAKYMAEDASSKKFLISNFTYYKMTDSRLVLEQYNELLRILRRLTQDKMNMDKSIQVSCIIDKLPPSWKDFKHTLKYSKDELTLIELSSHLRIEESLKVQDSDKPKGNNVIGPSFVNMVEHNNSSRYNDNKGERKHHDTKADPNKKPKVYFVDDDDIAWWVDSGSTVHVCKDRCWFKTYESLNDRSILHMGNKSTALVHGRGCVDLRFCYVYLLHTKDEALDKYKVFKTKVELQQGSLIKRFRTNSGGEYMDTLYFQYVGIIHETTAPYTPQQNDISKRKNKVLKEMVNSMLSNSGLSQGSWGKAMLTACYLLNRVPNKRNKITPYELWTKKKPNLKYLRVWGCKEAVRLPDPKLKTLGERSIKCIFVGYAEHSKAFRFYVIKPNDSVAINSIIESRDAIFNEHRFSSVPRPSQRSLKDGTEDSGGSVVSDRITEEVVQDEISNQHSYCFNVEDDPKTFDETMMSQDAAFWKEAINDEMDSIMGNNTWVLTDLPPGIGYFDTYALVMDVKIAFLNEELEEKVYMNQPLGVCKMIKSLYGLKQTPKQLHQKFDEVVLSNGYLLNQADKCVYSKIDASGKEVIICLYVDDMLIFGTDQVQVNLTKEFLPSRFSMKDMGEAYVILGIRIKHESNGIEIYQSHYIEKVLKKFNHSDCTPVSTPLDNYEKLMPNNSPAVSKLEYSRVIGCLMYAMTCTRPDIAFVVGKLSRYTSNPGTQHWQAIQRVLKYLKKTTDYRSVYSSYPSVLEGYTDASWIRNTEDNLSTSGWVKPMAPISIHCDSVATLAKAYSQMYNEKSRHLGVRHSMIRELITNGLVSIEFVRSQQNLADHLTKDLARDLVIKSAERMGLDKEVVVGEGVVVISSSLDMLTNSCLGGIIVSLIFLEGLDEEAFVEFMVKWYEEDEDDRNEEDDLFN